MILAAAVLCGTFAFASRPATTSGSSVSVMNSGSELIRVFYKSLEARNVTVSIYNDKDELVFTDKIRHSDGFTRPYNFRDLPEGEYTIAVADESGKAIQKVNYAHKKTKTITKDILIAKVPNEEGKYVVSGYVSDNDKISVRVYNGDGALVFEKKYDADGSFGEVYNLKELDGSFSISVSDEDGTLKEFHI